MAEKQHMRIWTRRGLAGSAALMMALTVSGCQKGSDTSGGSGSASATTATSSSLAPIPEGSKSSSASTSGPSSSSAAAFPVFKPVTSDVPKDEKDAQEQAFKVVQLYYAVQIEILKSADPAQADQLYIAATDPYAGMRVDSLRKALQDDPPTYEGESTPELIEATAGHLSAPDGTLTKHASATVLVCEDNSGVKVTGKDGKEVETGTDRYLVEYGTRWDQETGEWKVSARSVPKGEDGKAQSC